jgi:hypothetical protein
MLQGIVPTIDILESMLKVYLVNKLLEGGR